MNIKYLFILLILLLYGLTSCHKSNQTPNPVIGNWQEVKLRMYELHGDTILYDTTYYQPFTKSDYIKFNEDGTCVIGQDHYYYDNMPGLPKTAQSIPPNSSVLDYLNIRSGYVITPLPGPTNPGGFVVTDTVFLSLPDTLRQQVIDYGHSSNSNDKGVAEAYYVR